MNKRPISVTIVSWLFIVSGTVGLIYHIADFKNKESIQTETSWICFVRFLAILGGLFMLRGSDWARWLSMVWIGWHVILSGFHSVFEVVVHGLLFVVFAYVLFRPQATAFFRAGRTAGLNKDVRFEEEQNGQNEGHRAS